MSLKVDVDKIENLSREELLEKLRRYQQEIDRFRLEQRKINTLFYITRNLSQELELDNLLRLVMDEVKDVIQADRCTVFLLDEERNELWSRLGHGLEVNELRFPMSKGIAGYVATTGEILKIDDCYNDSRFNPEIDRQTGYHTRNILTIPMRNKMMEIIGVFQVLNKRAGAFTDDDVQMIEAIAPIAAVQLENAQLYDELRRTFDSFILTLSQIVDARDPLTAGHSQRIMLYADAIAIKAGWPKKQREVLKTAALLHDLGKIGIRENILTKKGSLTEDEYEHIKSHVLLTSTFLKQIYFSREFKQVPQIAATHHERLNGSGYPNGLTGEHILAGGRILAIADIFDALTSKRHYRDRMELQEVFRILEEGAGKEFDAEYVDYFTQISLYDLVSILEYGQPLQLPAEELDILKHHTFGDLIQQLRSVQQTANGAKVFLKYYLKQY